MLFRLWEFSLEHDDAAEAVPHYVVPLVVEDQEQVVAQCVGLDVFGVEWELEGVGGI